MSVTKPLATSKSRQSRYKANGPFAEPRPLQPCIMTTAGPGSPRVGRSRSPVSSSFPLRLGNCTCSDACAPISDKSVKPKATLRQRAARQTVSLEGEIAILTVSLGEILARSTHFTAINFPSGPF